MRTPLPRPLVCFALFASVLGGMAPCAEAEGRQSVLNVILVAVEVPTRSPAGAVDFDDWEYWETSAPGFVQYLTGDLGFLKARSDSPLMSACSLSVVLSVDDRGTIPASVLDEGVEEFREPTGGASLVFLWLRNSGSAWALLHGLDSVTLSDRIEAAMRLDRAVRLLPSQTGFHSIMPPCLLSESSASPRQSLEQTLVADYRTRINHLVFALESQIAFHYANPRSGFGKAAPGAASVQLTSARESRAGDAITDTALGGENELLISVRGLARDKSTPEVLLKDRIIPHVAIVDSANRVAYELDGEGVFHTTPLDKFLEGEVDPGFFSLKDSDIRVRGKDGEIIRIRDIPQGDWHKITADFRALAHEATGKSGDYRFTKFEGDLASYHCGDAGFGLVQEAFERNGFIPQRADGLTAFTDTPHYVDAQITDSITVDMIGGGQTNPVEVAHRFDRAPDYRVQSLRALDVDTMQSSAYSAPQRTLNEAVDLHRMRGAEDYDIVRHGVGKNTPPDYQGTILRFPNDGLPDVQGPRQRMPEIHRQDPVYDDITRPGSWGPGGPGGGGGMTPNVFRDPLSDMRNRVAQMPVQNLKFAGVLRQPGGVLFAPEIEIVISEDGVSSDIETQVMDALADSDAVSTTVTIDGREMMAVRVPSSRNLFEVRTGYFYFVPDPASARDNGFAPSYTSGLPLDVGLGPGWSMAPYCIQLRDDKLRVDMVDFLGGTRYPYVLPEQEYPESPAVEIPLRKVSSSLQPNVTKVQSGYVADFADGRTVVFDKDGRMLSERMGEQPIRGYTYSGGKLIGLQQGGEAHLVTIQRNSISLETTTGAIVLNVMDGHLKTLRMEDGIASFDYGHHGWLTKAVINGGTVFENAYEQGGQLVACENAQGRTEYAYDHWLGKMTVHPEGVGQRVFFYDLNHRLIAYGEDPKQMTLLNYDARGSIFQMATGEYVNVDDERSRPRFRVKKLLLSGS